MADTLAQQRALILAKFQNPSGPATANCLNDSRMHPGSDVRHRLFDVVGTSRRPCCRSGSGTVCSDATPNDGDPGNWQCDAVAANPTGPFVVKVCWVEGQTWQVTIAADGTRDLNLGMREDQPVKHAIMTSRPILQRGVTLVELMIAMAIGLLIVLVVTSAYMSGIGTQRAQTDMTRLEESARFGFDLAVARDSPFGLPRRNLCLPGRLCRAPGPGILRNGPDRQRDSCNQRCRHALISAAA